MMRRRPLSLTFLIIAALIPAVRAHAGEATCAVSVHVISVLATDTKEGTDRRLIPAFGRQLESMFHYSSYRLMAGQEAKSECGHTITFALPGGRIMQIEPHGIEGGMILMRLLLFQGRQLMVVTNVKLNNQGMLMVGGPHYQQGMLITAIAANSPQLAPPEGHEFAKTPGGKQLSGGTHDSGVQPIMH